MPNSALTSGTGTNAQPPFYIRDPNSGLSFLIDTGAQCSIISAQHYHEPAESPLTLQAVNKSTIRTFGTKTMTLSLGLRRSFTWPFILAELDVSIIGSDFLSHFDISVHPRRSEIIDNTTQLRVRGSGSCSSSLVSVALTTHDVRYRNILQNHPELMTPSVTEFDSKHGVFHRIQTRGKPVYCRPRKLDASRLKIVRAEFEKMLSQGIIRPSKSPYASALHMVPKSEAGDWRPCGDYRALNRITVPDRYPIPYLQDFSAALYNTKVFSKIDLVKAFYQIPVHPEDVKKNSHNNAVWLLRDAPDALWLAQQCTDHATSDGLNSARLEFCLCLHR